MEINRGAHGRVGVDESKERAVHHVREWRDPVSASWSHSDEQSELGTHPPAAEPNPTEEAMTDLTPSSLAVPPDGEGHGVCAPLATPAADAPAPGEYATRRLLSAALSRASSASPERNRPCHPLSEAPLASNARHVLASATSAHSK